MATTADIPHFDHPFRFGPSLAVVVEQDSPEDIINCVAAILRTELGERVDLPEFGINSPVFETQPIDIAPIIELIVEQEPRAVAVIDQEQDVIDQLIVNLLVNVTQAETPNVQVQFGVENVQS
jgi:phage baseplate assembly protein W